MPRRLAAALALSLLVPSALAQSSVQAASTRVQEDELQAATLRLEAAVDRAEEAQLAGADQRMQRADLLGRAQDLRVEAASTLRQGASRARLVSGIDAVTAGLVALADASVAAAGGGTGSQPPFGEAEGAGTGLDNPHSATTVLRFRDVAEDALSVLPRLSESERSDVRQLVQAGDDVVAQVKDVGRSDHEARTGHLRRLEDITRQLQGLHQTGLLDRRKGQPFVPATRVANSWLPSTAEAAGLRALRVRFDRPGSAWVMLENTTDAPREWFVEIEFHDHVGESTGAGQAQSGPRQELKPREVRRVLVPMIPTDPRFWEETTGFTLYVE